MLLHKLFLNFFLFFILKKIFFIYFKRKLSITYLGTNFMVFWERCSKKSRLTSMSVRSNWGIWVFKFESSQWQHCIFMQLFYLFNAMVIVFHNIHNLEKSLSLIVMSSLFIFRLTEILLFNYDWLVAFHYIKYQKIPL